MYRYQYPNGKKRFYEIMKHYTSYYANYKNIPKSYMCVGISRMCPKWFLENQNELNNFLWVKDNILAPSEQLLNSAKHGNTDISQYKKEYIETLFKKIKEVGYKDIPDFIHQVDDSFSNCLSSYDAIVFMCYESPNEFCHRHLLRRLLNNVYNIDCEEYGVKDIDTWGYKPTNNKHQEEKNTTALF